MYKCAIVGCGPRAAEHLDAYKHITRGKVVAVCDQVEANVVGLADRFHIAGRYTDLTTMLERERPDLLHVVTGPNHRVNILTTAEACGIPAMVVEKPLATQGEDYLALCRFRANAHSKICVNHQLHFHPRLQQLLSYVREGGIGELRFIEASARLNLAYQGTHILELVHAFAGDVAAISVFGQCAGTEGLQGKKGHFSPDQTAAQIAFDNGLRAQIMAGPISPEVNGGPIWSHKRIAIMGTRGLVHWTMKHWERTLPDGSIDKGDHIYGEEDILGQAKLVETMFDWLEDDKLVHPTNLEASLKQFNVILGIYLSAIHHRMITLPVQPEPDIIRRLKERIDLVEAGK